MTHHIVKPKYQNSSLCLNVSCQNIAWYFELCTRRKIDHKRLLRNIDYSKDHLLNPASFIDWLSFCKLNDNLLVYLSEAELREAGANSWNTNSFRHFNAIGSFTNSLKTQFESSFGSSGYFAKIFPCDFSLKEIKKNLFEIKFTMRNNLPTCRSFHLILAGQMSSLPNSLGYDAENVSIQHTNDGAVFTVFTNSNLAFGQKLKRFITRHTIPKSVIYELNQNYDDLQEKYRELGIHNQLLREAHNQIRESETKYELLSDNLSEVIWTTDLDLKLTYLSPSFKRLTGYEIEEGIEKPLNRFFTDESLSLIKQGLENVLSDGELANKLYKIEAQLLRKDGSSLWTEVNAKFELNDLGLPTRIIGTTKDISKKKQVETQLTRSEKKYREITNTAQDAIITFDKAGLITLANPAAAKMFGFKIEEFINQPIKIIIPDIFGASTSEVDQLNGLNVQFSGQTKLNESISLEISFAKHEKQSKVSYTCIARDISQRTKNEEEKKALQQQLLASQKVESIGHLTGGIAHDFNNLLVAINGYADLGINITSHDATSSHYFSEIQRAGLSAASMTKKLLSFGRQQTSEPSVSSFPILFQSLLPMIERLLPTNIEIIVDIKEKLNVLIDKGQIEQVIINLIVNAGDAMPEGGKLTITAKRTLISDDTITLPQGEYVLLIISDTGFGMDRETMGKMFDPFFTTKPEGSGTGLGMAVVSDIVNQHNGFIQVESQINKGSSFSFYLPSSDKDIGCTTPIEVSKNNCNGSESILVVEDNDQVRELAHLFLTESGYKVRAAYDGLDALEYFKHHHNEVDIIIMDVVMPRMSGKEVYERMLQINPEIKVIFTSGYSSKGAYTEFIADNKLDFIAKPYHTEGLKLKIRNILDRNN